VTFVASSDISIIFKEWACVESILLEHLSSTCHGKLTVRNRLPSQSYILNPYPGFSALDFSLLDPHWGTIDDWRSFIDELHSRDMYFMADITVGTMGDFIGFSG
jgi:hypothetical protein